MTRLSRLARAFFLPLAIVATAASSMRAAVAQRPANGLRFEVTYPASLGKGPLDGRVLLLISTDDKAEPRFQISDTSINSQQVFGVDVDAFKPGDKAVIEGGVPGYPFESLT